MIAPAQGGLTIVFVWQLTCTVLITLYKQGGIFQFDANQFIATVRAVLVALFTSAYLLKH